MATYESLRASLQPRPLPKIMERFPDPPRPRAFEIDERKLKSVLPPPEHSGPWYEGLKWAAAIIGILVMLIGSAAPFLLGLARALL